MENAKMKLIINGTSFILIYIIVAENNYSDTPIDMEKAGNKWISSTMCGRLLPVGGRDEWPRQTRNKRWHRSVFLP